MIIDWPLIVNEDGVSTRSLVSKLKGIVSPCQCQLIAWAVDVAVE